VVKIKKKVILGCDGGRIRKKGQAKNAEKGLKGIVNVATATEVKALGEEGGPTVARASENEILLWFLAGPEP